MSRRLASGPKSGKPFLRWGMSGRLALGPESDKSFRLGNEQQIGFGPQIRQITLLSMLLPSPIAYHFLDPASPARTNPLPIHLHAHTYPCISQVRE